MVGDITISESVGGSSKTDATLMGTTPDKEDGEEGRAMAAFGELGL